MEWRWGGGAGGSKIGLGENGGCGEGDNSIVRGDVMRRGPGGDGEEVEVVIVVVVV